jgi:hypothetical protein
VAVFRNPELPLDTLRVTVPVGGINPWPQISNAVIYDQNGNGIGDSICVTFGGTFEDSIDIKTAEFTWPMNQISYSANIGQGNLYNNNTIAFSYDPGTAAPVWTKDTSAITVKLDSLQAEITRTSMLDDGIGPILEEALVVRRYTAQPDTFRVRITEPVEVSQVSGNSFVLIKENHVKEIDIGPVGAVTDLGGESYIQFLVADLGPDAPTDGDSLKILHTGPVIDKKGNRAHEDNPPVPLQFFNNYMIQKAAYHDTDTRPDGYIDLISVTMNVVPASFDFSNLASEIRLPPDRNFSVLTAGSFTARAYGFDISVVQAKTDDPNTAVDSDDRLVIGTNTSIGAGSVIVPVSVAIADSLGPVIVRGIFCPKGEIDNAGLPDTLIVDFSEEVRVPSVKGPFRFFDISGSFPVGYSMTLTPQGSTPGRALTFLVDNTEKPFPQNGDSLWIIGGSNVVDIVSIVQDRDTKPAPLIVRPYPLALKTTILNPVSLSHPEIHNNLVSRYNLGSNNKGTLVIVDIESPVADPSAFSGNLDIFDAVGNITRRDIGSEYVEYTDKYGMRRNALTLVWDIRNENGRMVGPAEYCGVLSIRRGNAVIEKKKVLIGVKY